MVLTIHHLGISQSERIIFLCEELDIPYKIVHHTRSPMLSPDSLKAVPGNATGKSPFVEDSDAGITLAESGAIVEYIIHRYGGGRLAVKPTASNYAEYLQWFHFSNATLQPQMVGAMFPSDDKKVQAFRDDRLYNGALGVMDSRLKKSKWLAGDEFTAADIMPMYTITTQRYWGPPVDLARFPNILRWVQDVAARPAYQKAIEKGDPEMRLLIDAKGPEKTLAQLGGIEAGSWKK